MAQSTFLSILSFSKSHFLSQTFLPQLMFTKWFFVIVVLLLSHDWPFATPWTAACQASLSITNSWSSPKLIAIESVMPSSHLILCRSLLLLPSISPSRGFVLLDSLSYLFIKKIQKLDELKNWGEWSPALIYGPQPIFHSCNTNL